VRANLTLLKQAIQILPASYKYDEARYLAALLLVWLLDECLCWVVLAVLRTLEGCAGLADRADVTAVSNLMVTHKDTDQQLFSDRHGALSLELLSCRMRMRGNTAATAATAAGCFPNRIAAAAGF
jgi:hypothetical protein